jgi:hypothetical protein
MRLTGGKRASDDQIKAAEELDIELPDGYTWVRGHYRGPRNVGEDERVLRMRWTPAGDEDEQSAA